ncbi:DUF2235 domain-containing protein [Caballeronia sp.]|uniref:DUF2235 domain-containing protein n=1 Tax=Caballeronia sp. TaxID=1931223 RepID=UPI003C4B0363
MSKNIVFCADGTWNGPDEDDDQDGVPETTNVWKLFLNLASDVLPDSVLYAKEQESSYSNAGACVQVAKYLHGVGDAQNPIIKMLGGVFGSGLIARIVRGYTFISRNYQPGDRIDLVGFSRGSYTARALGGLIVDQGLLDRNTLDLTDPLVGYRKGIAAWRAHRVNRLPGIATWNPRIQALFNDVDSFLTLSQPIGKSELIPDVPIQAIAVWDTVGSMGIPLYAGGGDQRVDVFRFADTDLNPAVANGFHAVSLDEQRADFTPTLWSTRTGVLQAVFPGAHADVGGGYPSTGSQTGLSDGALAWMMGCLSSMTDGPRFRQPPLPIAPNAMGVAHQPWKTGVFATLPFGPRDFTQYLPLGAHGSIRDRLAAGLVQADPAATAGPYQPSTMASFLNGNTTWL